MVSLGKMKSHLLSIFAISIVSHLVSIFEIKFSVYKQASKQPTNQPTKQTPYREDKSLCSAAGATKKLSSPSAGNRKRRTACIITCPSAIQSWISIPGYLFSPGREGTRNQGNHNIMEMGYPFPQKGHGPSGSGSIMTW